MKKKKDAELSKKLRMKLRRALWRDVNNAAREQGKKADNDFARRFIFQRLTGVSV